jgi:excisionase family DNA binding protein
MNEELLTVEELADRLKVPASWIYQRTRCRSRDRLPHIKIGKYLRFEEKAVQAWLEQRRHDYQNLPSEQRNAR